MNRNRPAYGIEAVPHYLREAKQFVAQYQRHNRPTVGGLFALRLNGFMSAGCSP